MPDRKPDASQHGTVIDIAHRGGNAVAPNRLMPRTAVIAAANRAVRAALECAPPTGAGATVAELVGHDLGGDWQAFVAERIDTFATGYFDEGPRSWRSPLHGETPYGAWRGEAELDRTPEILGLKGFRGIARTLPCDADTVLLQAAHELRLDGEAFDTYLRGLLASIVDWADYSRRRVSGNPFVGRSDARAKELLAIRAAWDLALLDAFGGRCRGIAARLRDALARPGAFTAVEAHNATRGLPERRSA